MQVRGNYAAEISVVFVSTLRPERVSGPFASTGISKDSSAMTSRTGRLWAVIQAWRESFAWDPPSQNEMADRFKVSKSSLSDYKYGRSTPSPAFLLLVAEAIQVPYEVVLNAMLEDRGYRGESLARIREELMGNAEHPAPKNRPALVPAYEPTSDEQADIVKGVEAAAAARRAASAGKAAKKAADEAGEENQDVNGDDAGA